MSSTAIIDLDSVAYTIFHPNKVLDEYGKPLRENNKFVYQEKTEDEIIQSCDEVMSDILNKSKATSYIAFIKGKNTIQSRLSVNPEYKQNRNSEQPKYWELTKSLLIDRWGAIPVDDIEVDDAVNIIYLSNKNEFFRCAIDKDLLELEGINYNWRLDKWYDISKEEASINFWIDMITGQPGDNIKGIPRKGEKFAELMIAQSNLKGEQFYGNIFNEYIKYFGEYKGIQEFHKNYLSLKILEQYEGFVVPEIINYNNRVEELF